MAGGWGGARVGSGPKPKPKKEVPPNPFTMLHGGKTLASALSQPDEPVSSAGHELCDPPEGLPVDQQAFWREHAPLAIERRTLTKATVPAFKLLCELHAKKVMVGLMVDKGALGGLRIFLQLAKQVEALMARFCLAPFGKPTTAEKVAAAENPWSRVVAK